MDLLWRIANDNAQSSTETGITIGDDHVFRVVLRMIAHKKTDELGRNDLQFEVLLNELREDQAAT